MRLKVAVVLLAVGIVAGLGLSPVTVPQAGAAGLAIPPGTSRMSASAMLAFADMVAELPASAPVGKGHAQARRHRAEHVRSEGARATHPGPRPAPASYVNQAGPAVVTLPATTLPADPIRGGSIPVVRRGTGTLRSAQSTSGSTSALAPSPGSWSVERSIPRMVHFFALPTTPTSDDYLACAGSGNDPAESLGAARQQFACYQVDRTANTMTAVPLPDDWFCSAAVHDQNGDIVTAGGTSAYPSTNRTVAKTWGGLSTSYRYQTQSGTVTRLGDMSVPRWYPNLFKNQNNDIYVQGGQNNGKQQAAWEVMRAGTDSWQVLPFQRVMNSYADMQLIAPDTFAYTGAVGLVTVKQPFIINMQNFSVTPLSGLRDVSSRRYASGFLAYPAQDQKVLVVGGGNNDNTGSTAAIDMVDYSTWPAQVPHYVPRGPLPTPMMYVQMVNLPNGQIFATGGSSAWRTGDVLWAGFYDIASDTWQLVTPPTIGRDYHSNLWVNTDGSVSVSGGNPTVKVFHPEVETYRPWYMDRDRPTIEVDTMPGPPSGQTLSNLAKAGTYTLDVEVPRGAQIGSVTLDAARAMTHVSSDSDQGMFSVPFTANDNPWHWPHLGSTRVSITIPDTALLTPGAYKVSVVTTDNVPSTSVWVKVV